MEWGGGREVRGGCPHGPPVAPRCAPSPPLPTSHLANGTHKQISDNGHAPSPTVSSIAATGSPTRPGRGTAAFDRDGRQAAREFHGNVAGGAYVLAVNRKYDDCHGGPSPTPQELTRAGHCRVGGRGTGPLGGFRPAGGSALPKKKLCGMFRNEMSHDPLAFFRVNVPADPFPYLRGCARSGRSRARLARFRWREKRSITKARKVPLIRYSVTREQDPMFYDARVICQSNMGIELCTNIVILFF